MPTSQVNEAIQNLHGTEHFRDGAALTDGQLLGRFIERRDEAAFTALVEQHGAMVWSVCHRILGNRQDAEDAFQASFLVLIRKAASIVPREMVANWLYGVAHRTALLARRTATRRKARERQVVKVPEPAAAEQELWNDLRPLLDQELSRLPDKYRVVIVLCDLEGKTRTEAARQLSLAPGTVGSRLARARARLAKRLAQHGLAVSGGVLAAVLSSTAAPACAPPAVVSGTVKAATLFAAGQGAALPVTVATLIEAVLKTMLLSKLKTAAVALLALFVLEIGAAAVLSRIAAAEQSEKEATTRKLDRGETVPEKVTRENPDTGVVPPVADKGEVKIGAPCEYKALSYEDIKTLEFRKRGTDTAEDGLNMLGDAG
jgi:RNA polymerase sigma factor (sigma-70 family)